MSEQESGLLPTAESRPGDPSPGRVAEPGNRRHPRHWPFRLKLGVFALALGLVPAAAVATVLVPQGNRLARDAQSSDTVSRARTNATFLQSVLDRDTYLLQGIAAADPALALVDHPVVAQDQQIQQFLLTPLFGMATRAAPALRDGTVYVTTSGGTVLASTRRTLLQSTSGSTLAVQEAVASRAPAAVIAPSLGTARPALVIAAPILRGSLAIGAVVGEFSPTELLDPLAAMGASLRLADGRIIAAALPAGGPIQIAGTPLNASAPDPEVAAARAVPAGGDPPILADGARLVAVGPNALETPALRQSAGVLDGRLVPSLLIAIALATALAALAGTIRLAAPILRLARAMVSIRAGNFSTRVGLRGRDELGYVAATVDLLVARAQMLVNDLENQRLELENGIIQLFTELGEAARGDLTVRPTMSEGSLGAVADSVGILLERFNATVKRIQATASAVSSGTSQMAATVLRVSQEAQRQAQQLTSGASAIAEMASSAQSVSQRTLAATDVAAQAVSAVESGNKAVVIARDAVKRTSETSKKAARQVKSLGESAQLMGSALLLVQRNTEELHLIAGNASIEAARYAENGGVFRTVADSIEQLAGQSQVALRQIQTVIENTQRETSRVVAAIEEVTGEVMHVARAVTLAGENFDTINVVVQRLADLNMFIASASEQQARMAVDVAEVIGTLNEVSVQTSMNTAASAEAAVRLRQLTEQLSDSVSTLKVS